MPAQQKAELAMAAVQRINPTVQVELHAVRLDADNALALIRGYDVVVDCSDNFRTKYLINDAAVLAHRPAVFASVYQYEGQLQVYKPQPNHACLRCLWPDAVADGVVGNCAEAGVLGPVPGTFGTLQALLTLKILLGLTGQLEGELLLLDFTNFSTLKLKAPRRAECRAPECAHIREIAPRGCADRDRIALAVRCGAARLRSDRHPHRRRGRGAARRRRGTSPCPFCWRIPACSRRPGSILLVCASGKRSLAAARELRKRGLTVRSLAGGLQALED